MNRLSNLYVRLDRWQDSVDLRIRDADLQPTDTPMTLNAVWGKAISEQDWDGAQPYIIRANRLLASQGDKADPHDVTYMKLLPVFKDSSQGDIQQAHAKLIEVERPSNKKDLMSFELGVFREVFGKFREADKHFHELSNEESFDDAQWLRLTARGESRPLKPPGPESDAPPEFPPFPNPIDPRWPVVVEMVRQGMVSEVEEALRAARPFPAPIAEGEVALAREETAKAFPLFEGGLKAMLPWPVVIFFQGTHSLARAYEKQGKLEDALRILKQAADEKGRAYSFPWGSEGLQLNWQRNQLQLRSPLPEDGPRHGSREGRR